MKTIQQNLLVLRNASLLSGLFAGLTLPLGMQLTRIDWYANPLIFAAVTFATASNLGFALFLFLHARNVSKRIEARFLPTPLGEIQQAFLPLRQKSSFRYANAILQIVLGAGWLFISAGLHSWDFTGCFLAAIFLAGGSWELWKLYRGRA